MKPKSRSGNDGEKRSRGSKSGNIFDDLKKNSDKRSSSDKPTRRTDDKKSDRSSSDGDKKRSSDSFGSKVKRNSDSKSFGTGKPIRRGKDSPHGVKKKPYLKKDDDNSFYSKAKKRSEERPYPKKDFDKRSTEEDKPYKKRNDDGFDEEKRKPFSKSELDKRSREADRPYKKSGISSAAEEKRKPYPKRDEKRSSEEDKPYKKRNDDSFDEEKKPYAKRGESDSSKKSDFDSFRSKIRRGAGRSSGDDKPINKDNISFSKDKKRPYPKADGDSFRSKIKRGSDSRSKEERPYKKTDDNASASKPVKKSDDDSSGKIRLNKFISNAGICSRREADQLIESGAVTVNGKIIAELGYKVNPTDIISYGGTPIKREKNVYVLLNKPKDFITTTDDPSGRKTVLDLVKNAGRERIYPVGRLDRNTTGLLLLTNDGELATRLTHPKYGVRKVYHVTLDKPLSKEDLQKIRKGLELEDGLVEVDEIDYAVAATTKREVGVEIHSGRNRIVRRIFESLGYEVLKLDRMVFAGLTKKDLPRGKWRFLSIKEVSFLKMIG